jgi:DNA-directed RNA polymerase subunit N (RpoN/RPB10)
MSLPVSCFSCNFRLGRYELKYQQILKETEEEVKATIEPEDMIFLKDIIEEKAINRLMGEIYESKKITKKKSEQKVEVKQTKKSKKVKVKNEEEYQKSLIKLKVEGENVDKFLRYCCVRMFLGYVDTIGKALKYQEDTEPKKKEK